jgi:hypothetical protein
MAQAPVTEPADRPHTTAQIPATAPAVAWQPYPCRPVVFQEPFLSGWAGNRFSVAPGTWSMVPVRNQMYLPQPVFGNAPVRAWSPPPVPGLRRGFISNRLRLR